MTKEQIIKGAIRLIEEIAQVKNMEVINRGTGHAFEGTVWNFGDDSGIPEVYAEKDGYSIWLRSFWGNPEIDVRRQVKDGEELLVLNYSDSVKDKEAGKYVHTGDFKVHEVRVDARWNYKACICQVYDMIDDIERIALS